MVASITFLFSSRLELGVMESVGVRNSGNNTSLEYQIIKIPYFIEDPSIHILHDLG